MITVGADSRIARRTTVPGPAENQARREGGARRRAVLAALALLPSLAAQAATLPRDLTELSLDELIDIEVTSVSKRAEPLAEAAAAVFVLTGEEIQRSGARSIAEALRLVPGLHVARIGDINTHVVSARGFADRLSDKLEVLIDGRTVYTPLFSGVFWDTLDTFLPDIERIEVIRGPGATLWGTNAVNGVINIVTRPASATHGNLLHGGAGTEERSFTGLRSGAAVGESGHVRVYAKQFERDAPKLRDGSDSFNVMRHRQAGLRGDWAPAAAHHLTVSGDLYDGAREDQFEAPPQAGDVETSGANALARWSWQPGPDSEVSAQAFYDHSERFIPDIVFKEQRDIVDLEVQHRFAWGARQTVVYGAGYRQSHDVTGTPPLVFIFVPPTETLDYYNAFVQDQIALWSGAELTLGSKFERNDYTGWEIQPNARLGWRASDAWFSWAAVSRASRTPSRLDHDLATFNPALRVGNPEQDTEKLWAYEWGLRFFAAHNLSVDLATFYNAYDDLRSSEAAVPVARFGNGVTGHATGAELAVGWQPAATLELRAFYAWLQLNLHSKPGSTDTGTARSAENQAPAHQAGLRAAWQPAAAWNVAAFLRYVAALTPANGRVPAYTELNLRAAWRPRRNFELAVVGENLLDRQHGEFLTPIGTAYVESERSGLLEITWALD